MSFPKANLRCWCRCAHSIFTLSIMFTAKLFLHWTKESPRFPFGPYHFSLEPNTNVFSPTHKVSRGVFCAINISHRRIKREAFLQLFLKSLQKRVEKALEPETHQNFALSSHQREKSKFHQAKKLVRTLKSESPSCIRRQIFSMLHCLFFVVKSCVLLTLFSALFQDCHHEGPVSAARPFRRPPKREKKANVTVTCVYP